MRPWMAERGIDIVAMTDAPVEAVARQIDRDGLGFLILVDSNLSATRRLVGLTAMD